MAQNRYMAQATFWLKGQQRKILEEHDNEYPGIPCRYV